MEKLKIRMGWNNNEEIDRTIESLDNGTICNKSLISKRTFPSTLKTHTSLYTHTFQKQQDDGKCPFTY